jgi:hypothetical protein
VSSNQVSESVKGRRLIVCIKVIEAADLSIAVPRTLHLFFGALSEVSRSVEIGHSLTLLRTGKAASLTRGVIASIISINEKRDERWFALAMDELGISGDVLRHLLAHGDSVLLANLIHITRHFSDSLGSDLTRKTLSILPSVSNFDILNTLPELQHNFCALWNEIVQQARSSGGDNNPFIDILVKIRGLYVTLHGADAAVGYFFASATGDDDVFFCQPASYPSCTIPDHDCNLTTHKQEGGGNTAGGASHSTTATSPIPLSGSSLGVLDVPPHVPSPEPSSYSAPSGRYTCPIASPHMATSIVQGVADTPLTSSVAQPITRSSSVTGDAPRPDEGMTVSSTALDSSVIQRSDYIRRGLESPSSASTNTLSHSNPQAATIAGPDIPKMAGTFSSATPRANAQDLDPTI